MSVFSIAVPCCQGDGADCVCSDNERVIRAYADGLDLPPMTTEQREWCIGEAERNGEGSYPREETERLNDKDLATAVLNAWWDYVRSNCL